MNARVKILTGEGPVHWPGECARCCGTGKLQAVHVGIARDVTSLVDGVQGKARYQTMGMHYPVCNAHAGWAAFASWLTRKSPLPRLLRWAGYLFGVPSLLLLPLKLPSLLSGTGSGMQADPGLFFPLFMVASACLLVLTLLAYRRVPVRLLKLESDALLIRFANERFARHFARANPALVLPAK
jgi:hypothetical protein